MPPPRRRENRLHLPKNGPFMLRDIFCQGATFSGMANDTTEAVPADRTSLCLFIGAPRPPFRPHGTHRTPSDMRSSSYLCRQNNVKLPARSPLPPINVTAKASSRTLPPSGKAFIKDRPRHGGRRKTLSDKEKGKLSQFTS